MYCTEYEWCTGTTGYTTNCTVLYCTEYEWCTGTTGYTSNCILYCTVQGMSGVLVLLDMLLTVLSILLNLSVIICLRDSKVRDNFIPNSLFSLFLSLF